MDLIPSLAFTALIEMHPRYPQMTLGDPEAKSLTDGLRRAMEDAVAQRHPDLWVIAREWISLNQDAFAAVQA
jgi:hypothetical protein